MRLSLYSFIIILIISNVFYSSNTYAGWPIFSVMTPQKIVTDLINTNGCPKGEGFIPLDTEVKIKNYYIPRNESWFWTYTGDNKCQLLPKNLQYIGFHQTGHYSGDLIKTIYGTTHKPLFQFTFTIPGPYWYCGYLVGSNLPETIACAQDQ